MTRTRDAIGPNRPVRVSEREYKCLDVLVIASLDDANCLYMREIAKKTCLEIVQVRKSVRSLARKGLAEYVRGLFDDDGKVAGSGYCCTRKGMDLIEAGTPVRRRG